jgi:two-component sensor histidine kinase
MSESTSEGECYSLRQTPAGGLVAAIERLAGARAVEDVVETIRATARKLIGSDGITVILRDGELCHYVEEDALSPLWKGSRFPMTACVSGWAMINGETAVIPDIRHDPRVPYPLYAETFVRAMAMVPVGVDDPVGAIGAYWSQPYAPAPEEIDTLQTLARAAATAIRNASLVEALSRALSEAELARDELRHRVKNAYAGAQALAGLTLPPEQARSLSTRLGALARAHELLDTKLAREDFISLRELVEAELEPYQLETPDRFDITGPRVVLHSAGAISLGLALNELATNSLKYGALSSRIGHLDVRWRIEGGHLVLDWVESDGPEVLGAALEGFGSRLLRRLVEGQLRGTLSRRLERRGVTCSIEFPLGAAAALAPSVETART